MSRLDRDPDEALGVRLESARRDLDDLRQPQTFGASDVRTYRLFNTSGGADIMLYGLSTTPRCVEVTLTPTTAVANPAIAFDFGFTAQYSGTDLYWYSTQPLAPMAGVQKFRLYIVMRTGTVDAALRFTFWTISPAVYTAVEITV